MEKPKFDRPAINRINAGVPDKFGMKTNVRPITEIDNNSIRELLEKYGSPLYILSEKTIRDTYREAASAFTTRYPKVQFAWSYKTNYMNAVCRVYHQEGSWAEVVSGFEYEKAIANGVPGNKIIFNGPDKSRNDLERAIQNGSLIHIDHFDELYEVIDIVEKGGEKAKVAIRINMDTGIYPQWDRFGFNYENGEAWAAVNKIMAAENMELIGLHTHIGTYIMAPTSYGVATAKIAALAVRIDRKFDHAIKYIDVGGGFASKNTLKGAYLPGSDTCPSFDDYAEAITGALTNSDIRHDRMPTLFLETGRALIAIGLLLYSRIAFSLSVIGFFVAYLFYDLIGANITQIHYSYIGFNYILTSIALGGFFLIPSIRSYTWVIVLIPLVAIITISLNTIFLIVKLPVYSLPFNMVVLLFIYVLKFRSEYSPALAEVYYQYNSPEKNLYIFLNNHERFRFKHISQIKLPFYGTWDISQGHNGEHTHKDHWRHAWDFIILNREGAQYKNSGDYPEDYFCFGKPVIAPETGIVEKVVNDIDDNVIGEVNLQQNWGNTIIIKHDDDVYTKLSHLKKGSIKVEEGDKVKYGQIIAQCGNSGRSPYPHLHFQVQEYPYIGSATKDYPISSYVLHAEDSFSFCSYKRPQENEKVSNIEVNDLLKKAFNLTPGEILKFRVTGFRDIEEVKWEVRVNPHNETYLSCSRSGALAYFDRDDNQFRFTYFEGEKNCLLYYFFLSCYNVQEGFYQDLVLKDNYPLSLVYPKAILWFHDFISPFVRLAKAEYEMEYVSIDDHIAPSEIKLDSSLRNLFLKKELNTMKFHTTISQKGLQSLVIERKGTITKLERCDD